MYNKSKKSRSAPTTELRIVKVLPVVGKITRKSVFDDCRRSKIGKVGGRRAGKSPFAPFTNYAII